MSMNRFIQTCAVVGGIYLYLLCSQVSAADLYVNGSTGNDSWDGLSADWDGTHGPKDTIQSAIDGSTEGDVITIAPGTYVGIYDEDIGKTVIDMREKDITLKSEDPNNWSVVRSTAIAGGDSAIFFASNGEINGLTITSGNGIHCGISSPYNRGTRTLSSTSPTISRCLIDARYYAVTTYVNYQQGPTQPVIENNVISSILHGVKLDHQANSYGGANAIIRNNIILGKRNDRGSGVWCRMQKSLPVVENNIIMNWDMGHKINYEVLVDERKNLLKYNCFWNNTTNSIVETTSRVLDTDHINGNMSVDPMIADLDGPDADIASWSDNDLHLAAGSPGINTGDPSSIVNSTGYDFEGDSRVRSERIDMGIDEK